MRVHILQHTSETPPGSTESWLNMKKLAYAITLLHQGERLPALEDFDGLIVLGGEMNVDQEDLYSWLAPEKRLIRTAIEAGKVVVGLCLGGQLIAEVLGGQVGRHPHWEVGWQPVEFTGPMSNCKTIRMFQYHRYAFTTPPGAMQIATNQACAHQAFMFGEKVLGVQFHPEATSEWVLQCAAERDLPAADRYVQKPDEIVQDTVACLPPAQNWYFALLENLFRGIS